MSASEVRIHGEEARTHTHERHVRSFSRQNSGAEPLTVQRVGRMRVVSAEARVTGGGGGSGRRIGRQRKRIVDTHGTQISERADAQGGQRVLRHGQQGVGRWRWRRRCLAVRMIARHGERTQWWRRVAAAVQHRGRGRRLRCEEVTVRVQSRIEHGRRVTGRRDAADRRLAGGCRRGRRRRGRRNGNR